MAAGLTGSTVLPRVSTTYYLQNVSGGRPLRAADTLAVETFSVRRPARCASVPIPDGSLVAEPNPVLACADQDPSFTRTKLTGGARDRPGDEGFLAIRVLAPDGPLFSWGREYVYDYAPGWIRSGMEFFLVRPNVNGLRVLASGRVYILPIRFCRDLKVPLPPGLNATPGVVSACGTSPVSTLAWYTGQANPVEIREGSPSGPTLGRFTSDQLFDVAPKQTQVYYLLGYIAGQWQSLASTTVSVDRTGCR